MADSFKFRSLTSLNEGELVKALLDDRDYRWRMLNVRGLPSNPCVLTEVQLNGLGCLGDIDILAVAPNSPECAVAIQVKRIKVAQSTFTSGKPNKLYALAELYRQTNVVVNLGFHLVLAYVVVVVDSRIRNLDSLEYKGLTAELASTIQEAVTGDGLHNDAGLVKFEMVQPMDDKPLGTGTFGGQPVRQPTARTQSERVTRWIEERLKGRYA